MENIELNPDALPLLHEALAGLYHAVKDTNASQDPFVRSWLDHALLALVQAEGRK